MSTAEAETPAWVANIGSQRQAFELVAGPDNAARLQDLLERIASSLEVALHWHCCKLISMRALLAWWLAMYGSQQGKGRVDVPVPGPVNSSGSFMIPQGSEDKLPSQGVTVCFQGLAGDISTPPVRGGGEG